LVVSFTTENTKSAEELFQRHVVGHTPDRPIHNDTAVLM
jgi:hypothetical protein